MAPALQLRRPGLRHRCVSRCCILAAALGCHRLAAAEAEQPGGHVGAARDGAGDDGEGPTGGDEDDEDHGQDVSENLGRRVDAAFTSMQDGDPLEVYYAEFLLARWVLERAPWNAYHSGLAFVNNRTGDKVLFDFSPEDVSSVMNMILPTISMEDPVQTYLGDYKMGWRDAAKTQFFSEWPTSYTNFVRLGRLNGTILRRFARWATDDYAPRYKAFNPLEVAVAGRGNVVRSRMCHDFVTDALWVLYNMSVELKAEDGIFRDHIIMYASGTATEPQAPSRRSNRQWLRYLRTLQMFLEEIKQQFTHARGALIITWKLGIPVFLHTTEGDHRLRLVPPFLNYCYLPLAIPPKIHDPFGSMKLCALGMEANVHNSSAPLPWGPLLAAEERLDRPVLPLALLLVVLAAACCQAPPAEAAAASPAEAKEDENVQDEQKGCS